jgi:flagellar M-ring protein FliF
VGPGAIVAKVTATVDHSAVNQNTEVYDPDAVALRSERKVTQSSSNQTQQPAAVAGAQANLPLQPTGQAASSPTTQGNTANNDEVKNFEISKTTTTTVARLPRLQKLSVAVVVDGLDGKVRSADEMTRLNELARKAVGFDESRGDQFEMTSQLFGHSPEVAEVKPVEKTPIWIYGAVGAGVLVALMVAVALGRRGKKGVEQELILQPGATVAALEAKANAIDGVALEQKPSKELPEVPKPPVFVDSIADIRERARAMVKTDPERAVTLVRAWLSNDLEKGTIDG